MLSFKPLFTLLFHFHQEALPFLVTFSHKGGVICVPEVIDISPWNLNSSLCFIQLIISHDVFCIKVKQAEWQYTSLTCSFPYLEAVCYSISSCSCYFLTCIQISLEEGKVVWYSHLYNNFPQSVVIHTVKNFGVFIACIAGFFTTVPPLLSLVLTVGQFLGCSF